MSLRPCPRCGAPYQRSDPNPSCDSCGWAKRTGRRRDLDSEHQERSSRLVAEHVARKGWWCPGYNRVGHRAYDLQADHPDAVGLGGDPDQPLEVLCASCNGVKGADEGARLRAQP